MNKLALSTSQIKIGLLVDTVAGAQFYPLAVVSLSVVAFVAAVVMRLSLDVFAAMDWWGRVGVANVAGLWWRLVLPLRLNVCYG